LTAAASIVDAECREDASLEKLVAGDLTIDVAGGGSGNPIRCTWLGKSADRNPSTVLAPYFDRLIAEANTARSSIEMHFEKLDHFNSSTITVLIRVIQRARNTGVPVIMIYDQALKWQRLSFDALRVFEKDDSLFKIKVA
jgi:hypothetical protein